MPTSRPRSPLSAALLALAALVSAAPLEAQVFKVPRRVAEPAFWAGAHAGYFQLQDLADSRSNSVWRFGGMALIAFEDADDHDPFPGETVRSAWEASVTYAAPDAPNRGMTRR